MSLPTRLRAWLSTLSGTTTADTPNPSVTASASTDTTDTEPPHALRQHFAVSERAVNGFTAYSVAPMRFAESTTPTASTTTRTAPTELTTSSPHTPLTELPPDQAANKAVLYVLPGGFVNPIKKRNWDFVAQLAEAGLRVDIPLYGLLPDHTIADALPLLRHVYSDLVQQHGADNITIIGDSAGGGLALATLTHPTPAPTPKTVILNAPWVDMALSNPEIPSLEPSDPILDATTLRTQGASWARGVQALGFTGAEDAVSHPVVSPIHLDGPTITQALQGTHLHIWCGDRDLSLADARVLASTMKTHGVETTLREERGAIHMFHLTSSRHGRAARKEMIAIASA